PEVTRKRLYLEAMESVMTNSSKVLVDVKGGGNLLYLPLDKMMSGGSGGSSDGRRIIESDSASRQIEEQRLRDNVRGRGVR
ncbi:HflK protein, partial [hydrothermal vent metagenome]